MTIATVSSNSAHQKMKHMTTLDKGVREENLHALSRRWKLAQAGTMEDPKIMQRWFPGQREIFNILSVQTLDQVEEIADCGLPLFNLRLPMGINDSFFKQTVPADAFEAEAHQEVFLALVARLDSLRTSPTSLAMLYDMNSAQANFIGRHSSRELHCLAGDPSVVLVPAVTDEYFVLSAVEKMTARERTVLAGTTRRQRPL